MPVSAPPPAPVSLEQTLREHNGRIVDALDALVAASRNNDRGQVQKAWQAFEARLSAHLQTEERCVLMPLRASNPEKANEIIQDHRRLRALLSQLETAATEGTLRKSLIEGIIEGLSAVVRDESRFLCTWASSHLSDAERARFADGLLESEAVLMGKKMHARPSELPSAAKRREEDKDWEWKIR